MDREFLFCCLPPGAKTWTASWDLKSAPTIIFPSLLIPANSWRVSAQSYAAHTRAGNRTFRKLFVLVMLNWIPRHDLCCTAESPRSEERRVGKEGRDRW